MLLAVDDAGSTATPGWISQLRGRGHDHPDVITRQADDGKHLAALTDDECLGLVAMLIAAEDLDSIRHRAANQQQVRRIKMLMAG